MALKKGRPTDAPHNNKTTHPSGRRCSFYHIPFKNLDTINAIDMSRIKKRIIPSWSNNERLGGCSL